MSTYKEICQDVARECDIAQGETVPTSVTGQIGELNRIVNWVTDEYKRLQNQTRWRWLRRPFKLTTTADDDKYAFSDAKDAIDDATITRFRSWRLTDVHNPPKIYLQSSGVGSQVLLSWCSWNQFQFLYKTGSLQDQTSQPVHITVDPQDNIRLGLTPNDTYVVTGEYYRSPQILAADADEPEMPEEYHELIMYMALRRYALFESAPEILQVAKDGIRQYGNALRHTQGPRFRFQGPLA